MNDMPGTQNEPTNSPTSLIDPPTGPVPDPAPAPSADAAGEPPAPEGEGLSPAPEVTPLSFTDLTLPEGMAVPDEFQEQFLQAFNDPDLDPKARAQVLLNLHSQVLQKAADAYAGQWETLQNEWRQRVLAAFPGEKLTQSQTQIAKLVDRYGDKAVREAFALTGAGNNPAIYNFLARIAADLNEQPPVRGAPASAQPRDRASRLFNTQE